LNWKATRLQNGDGHFGVHARRHFISGFNRSHGGSRTHYSYDYKPPPRSSKPPTGGLLVSSFPFPSETAFFYFFHFNPIPI
jgi:hypothetical protein